MTAGRPVAFSAYGLALREWQDSDVDVLVHLFDTDEMNRWTPLPSPFSPSAAAAYVAGARDARERDGTLQLAVCEASEGRPIGEVILFPSGEPDAVEVAYAVGCDHRGAHVGARAVTAVLDLARLAGHLRAVLVIARDNLASQATASAAGFALTDAPVTVRERKGFVLHMQRWARHL